MVPLTVGLFLLFLAVGCYFYFVLSPGNVTNKRKWLPYMVVGLNFSIFLIALLSSTSQGEVLAYLILLLPFCVIFAILGVIQLKRTKFCDECGAPIVKRLSRQREYCANKKCTRYLAVEVRKI